MDLGYIVQRIAIAVIFLMVAILTGSFSIPMGGQNAFVGGGIAFLSFAACLYFLCQASIEMGHKDKDR